MAAVQVSLSHQPWSSTTPITSPEYARSSVGTPRRLEFGRKTVMRGDRLLMRSAQVNASLEAVLADPETLIGKVTPVDKDTFWPIVNAAADKSAIVLDMYTQWCGPCKVIAPKIEGLAEKYSDVVFLKLDCNDENRPLAKELKIKVVPTFKILKKGEVVTEVTGAKLEKLIEAIETVRSS